MLIEAYSERLTATSAHEIAKAILPSAKEEVKVHPEELQPEEKQPKTSVTLATVGLVLTMVVRTLSVVIVHQADRAAEQGNFKGVEFWHMVALACQGLRIAIPAVLLMFIPSSTIQGTLGILPPWFTDGMTIGGGFVVAVGYAMVINLMATKEVWPFFFLGFALAPLKELTLIATGIIGVCLAIIYLNLSKKGGSGNSGGSSSDDPLGDILDNY